MFLLQLLSLTLVSLFPSLAPTAQGGYSNEKFPDLGIELDRPRDY